MSLLQGCVAQWHFSLTPTPGWPLKAPQTTRPGIRTLLKLHLAGKVWLAGQGLRKPEKAVGVQEWGKGKISGSDAPVKARGTLGKSHCLSPSSLSHWQNTRTGAGKLSL